MEYEGRICRAPMERASYMLPVMVGCSYNKCKFCNLFRDLKYRELPLEQVEEELQRVKNCRLQFMKRAICRTDCICSCGNETVRRL